jgi:hypothetical protein
MTLWHFTFRGQARTEQATRWFDARRAAARAFRCAEQDAVPGRESRVGELDATVLGARGAVEGP